MVEGRPIPTKPGKKCQTPGCNKNTPTGLEATIFHSEYCGEHRCIFLYCSEKRLNGFQFCESHRCHHGFGCNGSVINIFRGDRYCSEHRCLFPNCTLARVSPTLCAEHKCRKMGCNADVHYVSGSRPYCCRLHNGICIYRLCVLPRVYLESCAAHKCIYSDCYEGAFEKDIEGGWVLPSQGCRRHTCAEDGCLMVPGRDNSEDYPTFCQSHRYRLGPGGSVGDSL